MFDPRVYGEDVAKILALDGGGERLMPLVRAKSGASQARDLVKAANLAPLLSAGLYLYFDCWDEAHTTAQDIHSAEGSYWHAVVHRQEPDAWNSGYWFRQVGTHAIFPELRVRAIDSGMACGARWDPIAFIDYCERAARGSDEERIAQEVQRAEWQLLFAWCARRA
jgi:hypothetical protein